MRLLFHDEVAQYRNFHIGDTLPFFSSSDEARCHVDRYGKELLSTQPRVCKELNIPSNSVSELGSTSFPN